MADEGLRDRIADQFSGRGERADIWRGFDLFLDTDRFLNLGYSGRLQPHVLGSPQRRLAVHVGETLARGLPKTEGLRLLDVGCGRGGPAIELAKTFRFDVTGIDLVASNVTLARAAARSDGSTAFAVGDATDLPIQDRTFSAATSIDAFVYVPERASAYGELARVLEEDGRAVVTDLVVGDDLSDGERATVEAFADAWDMPPLQPVSAYRRTVADAGFSVETVADVTQHSVGRFRTWAGLYLTVHRLGGPLVPRLLRAKDLDADAVTRQIRLAHAALPHLRHLIVEARNRP